MDPPISPSTARRLITRDLKAPVVFKRMIDQWKCRRWNLKDWAKKIGDQKIKFRIGDVNSCTTGPVWEGECDYLDGTVGEFVSWLESENDHDSSSNVFNPINQNTQWCYADYKYMAQLFDGNSEMLQVVNWNGFGFPNRTGRESSLWIGSKGSHTPCHYDTYGCNLVAQLYGIKRWILFPPWQTDDLHPTRIPYEESSVFSKVNIQNPSVTVHPSIKATTPYITYLKPGDVLFVPRHWWHFVESMEPSVAVNTWLELDEDDDSRLEEAITRLLVTSLAPTFKLDDWLNPTDEFTNPEVNVLYLQTVFKKCLMNESSPSHLLGGESTMACQDIPAPSSLPVLTTCKTSSTDVQDVNSDHPSPPIKRARKTEQCLEHQRAGDDTLQEYKDSLVPLHPVSFDDYLNLLSGCRADAEMASGTSVNPLNVTTDKVELTDPLTLTADTTFSEEFLNCLVNPRTVSFIAESLKKRLKLG